jgi:hypothetical protein
LFRVCDEKNRAIYKMVIGFKLVSVVFLLVALLSGRQSQLLPTLAVVLDIEMPRGALQLSG